PVGALHLKIRQQLAPARKRLLMLASIATGFLMWFILSMPMLPPAQGSSQDLPHRYEASIDQGAEEESGIAEDESETAGEEQLAQGKRPLVPAYILPSPIAVVKALGHLHF